MSQSQKKNKRINLKNQDKGSNERYEQKLLNRKKGNNKEKQQN